ncbi:acyltransferase [soil metagenome]
MEMTAITNEPAVTVAPTALRGPGRIIAVDIAKGLGIILVVFGHCWRGIYEAHVLTSAATFTAVDDWIYAFHMPLFFVLSGIFIERGVRRPFREILANKSATIAYPYLIWTIIQGVIQGLTVRYTNNPHPISDLPREIFIEPIFWFLYVLFFCEIIYSGLRKARVPILVIAGLTLVLYPFAYQLVWIPLMFMGLVAAYFALGAQFSTTLANFMARPQAGLSGLCFLVGATVLTSFMWLRPLTMFLQFIAALFGILMILGLANLLALAPGSKGLAFVGSMSLQVYLVHFIFVAGVRVVLTKVFHVYLLPVHLIGGLLVGLAAPICFTIFVSRKMGDVFFRAPWPMRRVH